MSTILRNFYHNLREPIIICDFSSDDETISQKTDFEHTLSRADTKNACSLQNVACNENAAISSAVPIKIKNVRNNKLSNINGIYFNKAFRNIFSDIFIENEESDDTLKSLKKLDYKFYFDLCLIESEKLKTYSPLIDAIESHGNLCLYGLYQKSEREFLYFLIQAFSLKKYRILYFYDITKETMLERLTSENERLKIQNQEFLNTNSKAQNQAVKMALLNRISTSISKTIDLNNMINTALNELGIIFGARKVYFAKRLQSPDGEAFEVEYIHSNQKNDEEKFKGQILRYDTITTDEILDNKISISVCLKEFENAKEPMKVPNTRIIIPIINKENLIAIVVILTPKKHIEDIEKELILGVSMQISSAITQAMLFKAVSDKKEELENALTELKETQLQLINSEKMASLGQLIASVAHEINTPLASICANNEITKRFFEKNTAFDNDTIEILKDTNSIDTEAIKRITNLVQSLKRFVRLDEMTSQSANINEELDLTLNLLRHKLKKDIKLVKNYGDIPLVECYPNMLNQVFLNILMNAIQSIEKQAGIENAGLSGTKTACSVLGGADKGALGAYLGEIIISTEIIDNMLVVKIEDNGAGIKDEDKKKIFQAGFTTKKVGEGTGLGLAICKKIIEKHNGEITFDSKSYKTKEGKIAKSTLFEIKLPV